jgi:hypothetical protein
MMSSRRKASGPDAMAFRFAAEIVMRTYVPVWGLLFDESLFREVFSDGQRPVASIGLE